MTKLNKVFEYLEKKGITVFPYYEDNELCGYEINTYTDCGVNEIFFLDFRESELSPENVNDFLEEFKDSMTFISIDGKIMLNRLCDSYKKTFTLKQSLKDFRKWEKNLNKILKKLTKKFGE